MLLSRRLHALGSMTGRRSRCMGGSTTMRESGKLLFPIFRDGTGTIQGIVPKAAVPAEVFETVKGLTQESSVIVTGKVRADKRAPGGYELDVENVEVVQQVPADDPLPDLAEGAWHRFPDGASAPVDADPAAGGDPADSGGDHQGGAGFSGRQRICADRSADSDAGGVRGDEHAVSGGLFWRRSLSDAERTAVYREHGAGAWARCTRLGRRFGRRSRRRGGT